jgi:hypothetical protein
MRDTAEHCQPLQIVTPARAVARAVVESSVPASSEPARAGLTWLAEMATTTLVDGDAGELVTLARAAFDGLAAADVQQRDVARARLLAQQIVIADASLALLTAIIGEQAHGGDERSAILADRLATGAARRLQILCAEHRASCMAERQPTVVAVGHADSVRIR